MYIVIRLMYSFDVMFSEYHLRVEGFIWKRYILCVVVDKFHKWAQQPRLYRNQSDKYRITVTNCTNIPVLVFF